MSKKSKKKPQAAAALAGNDIAVEPSMSASQVRLDDLRAQAAAHIDDRAWAELAALGRMPLADFHEEERPQARVWLLRAKILGLYPPGTKSLYDLAKPDREELAGALDELTQVVDAPHRQPEFELYLDTLGWSIHDCAKAFRHLSRACMEMTNVEWLRKLRGSAVRLMRAQEGLEFDVTAAEQQTLASLPDLTLALSEAYAAAEQGGALDDEGRALVEVMRLDLDLRMADPWDYGRVCDALLRLPGPSERDLIAMHEGVGANAWLTPRAWAFMWGLGHTSGEGFAELLQQFPDPLACDACEGLRRLLCALVAAPGEVDEHLALAVPALMRFADADAHWFGERLTMTVADEVRDVYIGLQGLDVPSVADLLLRLYEHAPEGFARQAELESLYRVFTASTQYSPLQDEERGDEKMPGLQWLCERSISFQFAAAFVIQGVAGRMRLLLDAMWRTTDAGIPPSQSYYSGDLDEELDEADAEPLLEALGRLAAVRGKMHANTQRMWLQVAEDIFDPLSKLGDKVRIRLLPLARFFCDDLLEKGHAFRLAYLEQVAGDPEKALRYYLAYIEAADGEPPASAINNAKLLWARSESLDKVQQFIDTLEEDLATSRSSDVVRQLLTDAKARLAVLNKRDQFERTAVSRWPTLTAPARKLLSVFATIKSYNGLAEVAEYAGMELKWAERHYDKLVDLGMLLTTDTTFRINPHIAPLLERESQHAVVGRIVRAQGTSAVKQVFNSQREFTIYQVLVQLCPNHLVFPNCSLQSVMNFDRMKELVSEDDFGYYLRASVDIVVVSSTTYLPMLAIEVDSVWHDTERQQRNDDKKDRLFAAAGIPFMRLRPVGSPSENTIRAQVAEHVDELVRSLRSDLPGYDQARGLLEDLSGVHR
ncbi:DUF2726 domain-containing protein [Roseateles sp. NT4]|uniref:DUF2726 domain-containing protein n=1 Tax=Roseateles sp. NT4 TaxID=3453715 RepID=UPI003EEC0DB0